MSKAMSLKAKIRNIAKQKNIPAQVILQNYMFKRLLAYYMEYSTRIYNVYLKYVAPEDIIVYSIPSTRCS